VSSSGHLTIAQYFLGINDGVLILDVCLHIGTLFAVIVFFFQDLRSLFKDIPMLINIGIVTAITGSVGIVFHDFFEVFFHSPSMVMFALIINGAVLLSIRKKNQRIKLFP